MVAIYFSYDEKGVFFSLSLSLCLTRCINYCLRMNLSDEKFPVVVFFLPVPINDDRTIGYDF